MDLLGGKKVKLFIESEKKPRKFLEFLKEFKGQSKNIITTKKKLIFQFLFDPM